MLRPANACSEQQTVLLVHVDIIRWVDDVQPGIVACQLTDAWGIDHTFVEKVPIITSANLDHHSPYPQPGWIACELVGQRRDANGRAITTIDTDTPWQIASTTGATHFDVLSEQLTQTVVSYLTIGIYAWSHVLPSSYQPASEQQTFYPTHRGSMLVFGSFMLLLAIYLLGTALTSGADQSLGSRFAYLIPLLGGGSCLAFGLTSKLHLSPSGLDFFQLGLHAATPWLNIETLTVAQVGPARITVVRILDPMNCTHGRARSGRLPG